MPHSRYQYSYSSVREHISISAAPPQRPSLWPVFTQTYTQCCAGFGLNWTVAKCNKYLLGWEAGLPTVAAAAAGALLLLRCYGMFFTSMKFGARSSLTSICFCLCDAAIVCATPLSHDNVSRAF